MKLIKLKRLKIALFAVIGFILAIIIYGLVQLIEPVAITPISRSPQPITLLFKSR